MEGDTENPDSDSRSIINLIDMDSEMVSSAESKSKCVQCEKEDDSKTFIDIYNLFCSKACRHEYLHNKKIPQTDKCQTLIYFDFMTLKRFHTFLEKQHSPNAELNINFAPAYFFDSIAFNKYLGKVAKGGTVGDVLLSVDVDKKIKKYWKAELIGMAGIFVRYRWLGCCRTFYGDLYNQDYETFKLLEAESETCNNGYRIEYAPPGPESKNKYLENQYYSDDINRKLIGDNLYSLFRDYYQAYRDHFDFETTYESVDADFLQEKNDCVNIVSFFGEWIRVKHLNRDLYRWVHPRNDTIFPAGFSHMIGCPINCTEEYEAKSRLLDEASCTKLPYMLKNYEDKLKDCLGMVLELIDPFYFQMTYARVEKVFDKGFLLISWMHKTTKRVFHRCFHYTSGNIYYYGFSKENGLPIGEMPAEYLGALRFDSPEMYKQKICKQNPFSVGMVLETFHLKWEKLAIGVVRSICKRILVISLLCDPIRKYYVDFESPHLLPFGTSLLYRSDPGNDMRLGMIEMIPLSLENFISNMKNLSELTNPQTMATSFLAKEVQEPMSPLEFLRSKSTLRVLCRPEIAFDLVKHLHIVLDLPMHLISNALRLITCGEDPRPYTPTANAHERAIKCQQLKVDWITFGKDFDLLAIPNDKHKVVEVKDAKDDDEEFVYIDDKEVCQQSDLEDVNVGKNQMKKQADKEQESVTIKQEVIDGEEICNNQDNEMIRKEDNVNQTDNKQPCASFNGFDFKNMESLINFKKFMITKLIARRTLITSKEFVSIVEKFDLNLSSLSSVYFINMLFNMPIPNPKTKVVVYRDEATNLLLGLKTSDGRVVNNYFNLFEGYDVNNVKEVRMSPFSFQSFNKKKDFDDDADASLVINKTSEGNDGGNINIIAKNKINIRSRQQNKQGIHEVDIFDGKNLVITFTLTYDGYAFRVQDEHGRTMIAGNYLAQLDKDDNLVVNDLYEPIEVPVEQMFDESLFKFPSKQQDEPTSDALENSKSMKWDDNQKDLSKYTTDQLIQFVADNYNCSELIQEAIRSMGLTGNSLITLFELYSTDQLKLDEANWNCFLEIYEIFKAKSEDELKKELHALIGQKWIDFDEDDEDADDEEFYPDEWLASEDDEMSDIDNYEADNYVNPLLCNLEEGAEELALFGEAKTAPTPHKEAVAVNVDHNYEMAEKVAGTPPKNTETNVCQSKVFDVITLDSDSDEAHFVGDHKGEDQVITIDSDSDEADAGVAEKEKTGAGDPETEYGVHDGETNQLFTIESDSGELNVGIDRQEIEETVNVDVGPDEAGASVDDGEEDQVITISSESYQVKAGGDEKDEAVDVVAGPDKPNAGIDEEEETVDFVAGPNEPNADVDEVEEAVDFVAEPDEPNAGIDEEEEAVDFVAGPDVPNAGVDEVEEAVDFVAGPDEADASVDEKEEVVDFVVGPDEADAGVDEEEEVEETIWFDAGPENDHGVADSNEYYANVDDEEADDVIAGADEADVAFNEPMMFHFVFPNEQESAYVDAEDNEAIFGQLNMDEQNQIAVKEENGPDKVSVVRDATTANPECKQEQLSEGDIGYQPLEDFPNSYPSMVNDSISPAACDVDEDYLQLIDEYIAMETSGEQDSDTFHNSFQSNDAEPTNKENYLTDGVNGLCTTQTTTTAAAATPVSTGEKRKSTSPNGSGSVVLKKLRKDP